MIENMKKIKTIILISMLLIAGLVKSQSNEVVDNHIALVEYWKTHDVTKEQKFSKYVESKYGEVTNFTAWKQENRFQYIKEIWYFAESFSIKHNHFASGSVSDDGTLNTYSIDESQIDISRFEYLRKQNEEAIVTLPGFKDAIILLPTSKLIYKP